MKRSGEFIIQSQVESLEEETDCSSNIRKLRNAKTFIARLLFPGNVDKARSVYRRSFFRNNKQIIYKNGECNIQYINVPEKGVRFLGDVFTTLVDLRWRYVIVIFCVSFLSTWFIFSLAWYLVCYNHGDFEPNHLPGNNEGWIPCVYEMKDFRSCFLYSIETQQTIGFGVRSITEECPDAILLTIVQSLFGIMCQAIMTGIAFAKLSRPQRRKKTLIFSKNAVISKHNGIPCFSFRVGDFRDSRILEAHVRALMIKSVLTLEGKVSSEEMIELNLGYDRGDDRVFLIWPLTILHEINKESPFYDMMQGEHFKQHFEIIVTLDGVNASTGNNIQGCSSYLPEEIVWNCRFEPVVSYDNDKEQYIVDYSKFDSVIRNHDFSINKKKCDNHLRETISLSDRIS